MRIPLRCLTFAGIASAALLIANAQAASSAPTSSTPQVLALVATGGPVELTCHGAECDAEFSAFCLQAERFSPTRGTAYELARIEDVRLLGTTRDGREIVLDAGRLLRMESMRTHVAMRLSVAREDVRRLGLTKLSVDVGETATMLPVIAGEGSEGDDTDVALLSGPLRAVGAEIVDRNRVRMGAARITNRIINLLPDNGPAAVRPDGPIWRRAVTATGDGKTGPRAHELARTALGMCNFAAAQARTGGGLRRCLQRKHDSLVDLLNSDYWKAVKTGS